MSYTITNLRPAQTYGISSAEYIKKTPHALFMTKTHGLGSGIYGVIKTPKMVHEINNDPVRKEELQTELVLQNPVILDTNEKFANFIQLSRYLMDICEAQINFKREDYNALTPYLQHYNLIRQTICPLSNNIVSAFSGFTKAYKAANIGDFLRQPINYLLEGPYDGIYNYNDNGNAFLTGSVAFIHHNPRHQKYAFDPEGPFLQPGSTLRGGALNIRQSPLKQAKHFKLNTIKKGLDNNKWICAKRINGIKYWKKL